MVRGNENRRFGSRACCWRRARNAYDRLTYGFVADFYHFHIGSFSWYVFNLADVAIVAGVAL